MHFEKINGKLIEKIDANQEKMKIGTFRKAFHDQTARVNVCVNFFLKNYLFEILIISINLSINTEYYKIKYNMYYISQFEHFQC